MISEFFSGLRAYIKGSDYYFRGFSVKYLIISGILSLSSFLLLAGIIFQWGDNLGLSLAEGISSQQMESGFLSKIISWISWVALWAVLIFVFKYIVLIVTAPVMSVLSEKVEQAETGQPIEQDLGIIKQLYLVVRGSRIALSNLVREIGLTIVLLILSLIPGALVITTPLIFLVQAYYAGFGNLDFFMERRFNIRDSRRFVSRHKGIAIANGSVFLAMLLIPIAGPFLAPSFASIAATISGLELLDKDYTF